MIMPAFCVVCARRGNRDKVNFFRLPAVLRFQYKPDLNELSKERRARWVEAIKKTHYSEEKLKYIRVCTMHFLSGRPAKLEDVDDLDWVPTQNLFKCERVKKSAKVPLIPEVEAVSVQKLIEDDLDCSTQEQSLKRGLPYATSVPVRKRLRSARATSVSSTTTVSPISEAEDERPGICRLCTGKTDLKFPLFEPNFQHKIESISSVKFKKDDQLPKICCEECVKSVMLCYKFQQTVIASDKKLREKVILGVTEEVQIIEEARQAPELYEVVHTDDEKSLEDEEKTTEFAARIDDEKLLVQDHNYVKLHYAKKDSGSDITPKTAPAQSISNESASVIKRSSRKIQTYLKPCKQVDSNRNRSIKNTNDATIVSKKNLSTKVIKQPASELVQEKQSESKCLACPQCRKTFISGKFLQDHLKKSHQCPHCDAILSKESMRRHVRSHSKTPKTCVVCGKTIKKRSHVNYSHSNSESARCQPCDRKFNTKQSKRSTTYTETRKFECDMCKQKFFSSYGLKKHINAAHAGATVYICHECKKGFCSHFAWKIHSKYHTEDSPLATSEDCDISKEKVSFLRHLNLKHSGNVNKEEDKM